MNIRQLQIAHDALQDRLILRVATQEDEEFRLWLTRHFLRELWPRLLPLLGKLQPAIVQSPHDAGPNKAPSFDQPFRDEQATYPLGANPLLISEIKVDAQDDGSCHVTFREGRERSFQLGLTPELLQALCAMLRAAAEQAQWGLGLDYVAGSADVASTSPSLPLYRLH